MIVKIFNANNNDAVALKNPDNLYRETESGGSIKLCFDISPKDEQYKLIAEEIKLEYDNIFYTIKKINERKTVSSIEAVIDLDDFKKQAYYEYYKTEYLLSDLLDDCLNGTGWLHKDSTLISRKHTVELKNCNTLDIINEASKLWGCQFSFDNKNKVITAIDTEIKQPTGVFFTDELNLLSVGFKGDSSSFITRLKCRGKKDENDNYLTFADINDGKDYVENYDYSDKVITGIWVDERYTDKQSLKDDAIEKLKTLAIPVRSYECTIADLAKIDPKYNNFAVALYDIVTLIDRERKTRVNHRIVKLREYDKTPLKNVITLNSVTHTITGNIKQLDTLISNAGDIKVDGITLNEFKRDINNNSLEIQKRYTKGETDTILDTKILQSESEIMTKVSEKYSTKEDTTNEISSAVTQTKSDITLDFKNGGLSSNVVFDGQGVKIYNGNLEIYDKPLADSTKKKILGTDDDGSLMLKGYLTQENSSIRLSVGKDVNGQYGAVSLFDISNYYKKTDGTYAPYIEMWPSSDNNSIITGIKSLKFGIKGVNHTGNTPTSLEVTSNGGSLSGTWNVNSLKVHENMIQFWYDNGAAESGFVGSGMLGDKHCLLLKSDGVPLCMTYADDSGNDGSKIVLEGSKGTLYGAWDFGQEQNFTKTINAPAFIARSGNTKVMSLYISSTNNPCFNSDNGKDFIFSVGGKSRLAARSTGGDMYGEWGIHTDSGYTSLITDQTGTGGGKLWGTWYLGNSTAITSDRNKKNSIENLPEQYSNLFDALTPVRYKFNDGESDRYHTGFISQDVETAINTVGLDTKDFGGYVKDKDGNHYLRYEEFIALNTAEIQKLKTQVNDLTKKLENQQKEINDLKALIQ